MEKNLTEGQVKEIAEKLEVEIEGKSKGSLAFDLMLKIRFSEKLDKAIQMYNDLVGG